MNVRRKFLTLPTTRLDAQRGQVLLIVVLVMVVALTVGLSLATRSVTTLRTSTEEENSQRAFSAAEAGIEQTIEQNRSIADGEIAESGTTFNTSIGSVVSSQFLLNNGALIPKDDGYDIWLSEYPNFATPLTGRFRILWGEQGETCSQNPAQNTLAALKVIVISGALNNPTMDHYFFDPCGSRRSANGAEQAAPGNYGIGGINFRLANRDPQFINFSSGRLARVIPLYANARVGVEFSNLSGSVPSQGNVISSTGSSGDVQRRVEVFQSYPKIPNEFFQYLIFSP